MPLYTATFYKTVSNDTGHERRVCQRVLEVEASTRALAIVPAKELFCMLERISDWSWHADEIALHERNTAEITPVHQRREQ
jgi:hypothetical protein